MRGNTDTNINILTVDDQEVVRKGIEALLRGYSWINVVEGCDSGESALDFLESNHEDVDVVVMDAKMDGIGGIEATRRIKQLYGDAVSVLILTGYDQLGRIAMKAGARGFVAKQARTEVLLQAILDIAQGARAFQNLGSVTLSKRHIEVLTLVAQGLSNEEIAQLLNLATNTINQHVSAILRKLRAKDRAQAAATGTRLGLIP